MGNASHTELHKLAGLEIMGTIHLKNVVCLGKKHQVSQQGGKEDGLREKLLKSTGYALTILGRKQWKKDISN